MVKQFIIEVATNGYESTKAAVAGGADRIELCAALSEGGLTPSAGTIKKCRTDFAVPIFPIIRPRSGDFLYSAAEFDCMLHDAFACKKEGCDGVVIGFLKNDGSVDAERTRKIVNAVYPLEVTFHRAFDRCRDAFEALETIIACGCTRILTSGQQPAAPEGARLISQLILKAAGRIVIMPGSGVRGGNIKALHEMTGAVEFHSSLKTTLQSEMHFRHPAFASAAESYTHPGINPQDVVLLRTALQA